MGSPGAVFEELGRELASRGFVMVEEVDQPEIFGSKYATYSREDESVRLIWDGKDEWLVLQRRGGLEKAWKDLSIETVGAGTATTKNVDALRAAFNRHVSR